MVGRPLQTSGAFAPGTCPLSLHIGVWDARLLLGRLRPAGARSVLQGQVREKRGAALRDGEDPFPTSPRASRASRQLPASSRAFRRFRLCSGP